jgi:hypothetical protein
MGTTTTHRLHKQDVRVRRGWEEPSTTTTLIDSSRVLNQKLGRKKRENKKRKGR